MNSDYEIVYSVADDYLTQMIELDKYAYTGDDVGEYALCKEWLEVNPEIYTILLHNGKVIGYINFMPVTNDCYFLFRQGKINDREITKSDILPFSSNRDNKCIFTSIVLKEEYRNSLSLNRLWQGFIAKINQLSDKGVRICNVIMDCVTDMGEKCAKEYLGAMYITDSRNGKIYEMEGLLTK